MDLFWRVLMMLHTVHMADMFPGNKMSRPGHDLLFKTRRNNKKSLETSYQLLHLTLNPTEQMRPCNDVTARAYVSRSRARAES